MSLGYHLYKKVLFNSLVFQYIGFTIKLHIWISLKKCVVLGDQLIT